MDIQVFQTFSLVAQLNNITQAAEKLNFTQPAVTAQIQALEEEYGVLLFERIGKKLYITDAGRALLEQLGTFLSQYDEIARTMRAFATNQTIRIGAATAAASYLLSPILLDFQKTENNIAVVVDICTNLPITLRGLLDDTFDIVIVHSAIHDSRIVQFAIAKEKLVWVAAASLVRGQNRHRHAKDYPFISFHPGCVYRNKIEEAIDYGRLHTVVEYSDAEAIKQAVLDGMGTSILPYVLVKRYLNDATLVEIPDAPAFAFDMSVAFHRHKKINPAMRALLSMFAKHAKVENQLLEYLTTAK